MLWRRAKRGAWASQEDEGGGEDFPEEATTKLSAGGQGTDSQTKRGGKSIHN